MTKPAIKVTHLSKEFRVWNKPSDMLMEAVTGRTRHTDFRALEDVSFELAPGSVLGVLGRNGAGKSTLLRLVAGTLEPSHGKVEVNGRIASILELGTGFHPEYSGRENIFLGGMCLGLSRSDIKKKVDEIIDFAELREFVDRPFRTYSTGMQARLTFAVATSIDPDILIIDEALSVGDARFTLKSFDRIQNFRKQGKAILLVSHDIQTVSAFCDTAILLERGRLIADGPSIKVVNVYHELLFGEARPVATEPVKAPADGTPVKGANVYHELVFGAGRPVAKEPISGSFEASKQHDVAQAEIGAEPPTPDVPAAAPVEAEHFARGASSSAIAGFSTETSPLWVDDGAEAAGDEPRVPIHEVAQTAASVTSGMGVGGEAEFGSVEVRKGAPELRIVPSEAEVTPELFLLSEDDGPLEMPKSEQYRRYGDQRVEIVRFQIVDTGGKRVTRLKSLNPYLFHMRLRANGAVTDVGVGIVVRTARGMQVTASNSLEPTPTLTHSFSDAGEEVDIVVPFDVNMGHGTYYASAICAASDGHKHDAQFDVLEFAVERTTCHDQSVANLGMSFEFAANYAAAPAKRAGGVR